MQVEWWEHTSLTYGNEIYLNTLHFEAVGMLKLLPHAPSHTYTSIKIQMDSEPIQTHQRWLEHSLRE